MGINWKLFWTLVVFTLFISFAAYAARSYARAQKAVVYR